MRARDVMCGAPSVCIAPLSGGVFFVLSDRTLAPLGPAGAPVRSARRRRRQGRR
jgi:hypothetical protein